MAIIEITNINDPRIQVFSRLTDPALRSKQRPGQALIIAESPKVINVALNAGLEPVSLLCERRHIEGMQQASLPAAPAYPSTPAAARC